MQRTDPYWWDDAGPPVSPPEHALPDETDVLVIGAGLTGLSAARTLAKAGKSVLVLEAGAPGSGASARNGGMIGSGHRLSVAATVAQFGESTARNLLQEAHLEALAFCKSAMREEEIDCDFAEPGRFRALWRTEEVEAEARGLEALQRLVDVEAEVIPRERQREEVGTDLYAGGVVFPKHGGLNPAKWVAGLLGAAQRAGAQVQGNTPVLRLERDGAHHRAGTPRGPVKAGAVLVATNGYTPGQFPTLKRRIVPVPSYIVVTEPLGENRIKSLFPNGRMIVESRLRHCYYRPSPDGTRIVFGGRAALFNAPETFAQNQLRRLMAEIFPDLDGVGLTHSWRGFTGFSFGFLPHVGQQDGVWHAMGYCGSGNAMAPYLGHKAALQILSDPDGETAFSQTPFPDRWWHRGKAWFLPFADAVFRVKDTAHGIGRLR